MACVKFLHCNRCYHVYNKSRKFYILSCLHTVCKNCLAQSNKGRDCPKCKKSISFRELNNELDPKLKEFFQASVPASLNHTLETIRFRDKQNHNLMNYYIELDKNVQKAKESQQYYRDKYLEMHNYAQKIRAYRNRLETQVRDLRQSKKLSNSFSLDRVDNNSSYTSATRMNDTFNRMSINKNSDKIGPPIKSLPIDDSFLKNPEIREVFSRNTSSSQQGTNLPTSKKSYQQDLSSSQQRRHNFSSSQKSTSTRNQPDYQLRTGFTSTPSSYSYSKNTRY